MKNAASKTVRRAGATVALAGALLATTGCGYIYEQPTTFMYDASDGVSFTMFPKGQRVDVRNIMVISAGKDQPGRVLGTVYNLGEEDQTVSFKMGDQSFDVKVPAGQHVILDDDANEIVVDNVSVHPGEMIQGSQAVIGETTEAFNMPILDGTLEEYEPYIPNAASSTTEGQFESEPNTKEDAAVAPATASPRS
ncbi:hypothetical protein [Rothia sp. ZJ1223]|uniref:hypothetical protein n=1 Tax=Rothia sp. ZJ1223 TaxID=2811098 RepID=UPI0019571FC9|nr:hypothetical protein [Rothia sp. ZJ1223]MBM7052251.1 hypothetical protein [Rothia sp. ZJ1223]